MLSQPTWHCVWATGEAPARSQHNLIRVVVSVCRRRLDNRPRGGGGSAWRSVALRSARLAPPLRRAIEPGAAPKPAYSFIPRPGEAVDVLVGTVVHRSGAHNWSRNEECLGGGRDGDGISIVGRPCYSGSNCGNVSLVPICAISKPERREKKIDL